jgi:transposase InsO family protein
VSEKYELIAAEKADPTSAYPVIKMCVWLGVSTSGFYDRLDAIQTARQRRRAKIIIHVKAAYAAGRGAYGVRRVHAVLARSDDPEVASCSEKLVRSVMAELDLAGCQPRGYKTTTQPDPEPPTAPQDLVQRDFTADRPGVKLVGDITYIRCWTGWLYLATVIDCCTREVIGWSMADHMRTSLVCDAISMAAGRGYLEPNAIFHSDRGSQYTSIEYAAHLKDLDIQSSMGRVGQCWDDALAESFFGALKNEMIHRTVFSTKKHARRAVAEYIEVFYNRTRLHSSLDYKTPAEIAQTYRQNIAKAA